MSSASAGSVNSNTGEKNFAELEGKLCPFCGRTQNLDAVSVSSAEAQQGDGPAAASSSAAASSESVVRTSSTSVVVGSGYAAAASEFGVVAVGPNTAAAASEIGVATVGPDGAAASCNAANGSTVTTGAHGDEPPPKRTAAKGKGAARKRS